MWRCDWGGIFGAGGWSTWPMGGGLFGLLLTVLLLAGLIYAFVLILRNFRSRQSDHTDRHDSFAILRERFARGEISSEEYERMKDILSR